MGNRGIVPRKFNLSRTWNLMFSFTPRPLKPRCSLNRRMGKSTVGLVVLENRKKFLLLVEIGPRFLGLQVRNLGTTHNELTLFNIPASTAEAE
jgi:hypothetical protein